MREPAQRDVEAAVNWYRDQAGADIALGFVDAVEEALGHVGRQPSVGSARYSVELGIPAQRCWQLDRFPHLVFYVERNDHVDVWRVLHGHRDIPTWMRDPTSRLLRNRSDTYDNRILTHTHESE